MTLINWISIGVVVALIIIFIILKTYVKRKTDEYDGLGGIIKRKKSKFVHSQKNFDKNDKNED